MSQPPACDYCRHRKRKCDRIAPRCSMCILKNRECRYTGHMRWVHIDPRSRPEQPTLGDISHTSIGEISEFPGVYFLDHDVFEHSGVGLPVVQLPLHQKIVEICSIASEISAKYFSWTHLWMPIVSRSKWRRLLGPLSRPSADAKLLLFSMKVLLWKPPEVTPLRQPRHEDYTILKNHLVKAEALGMLTLELLQAWILTTIYEYSHCIYPAAYISIGTCVRYSLALKINKQRLAEMHALEENLDAQEERRRVWWSVVILDRMISQSSDGPEPRTDDLLPVHDQAWDDGIIDMNRMYPVSAASSTNMGMFARLAQSAFLLGRVYRWKNHPTGDARFDRSEKLRLDRALHALLNLTNEEGSTRLMPICPQTALCFSALVILHGDCVVPKPSAWNGNFKLSVDFSHSSPTRNDGMAAIETLQLLQPIAQGSLTNTQLFYRRQPWSVEKSSPLLLHWTYLMAVVFLKISSCLESIQQDSGIDEMFRDHCADELAKEARQGVETMKVKLSLLGKQWIAADAYLKIIAAREAEALI